MRATSAAPVPRSRAQAVRLARQDVGAHGLDEGEVGQRQRAFLVAVADQRLAAAQGDVGGELLAERRLADARLADDHDQPALAGERGVEGLLQLLELRLAADEGAAGNGLAPGRLTEPLPIACNSTAARRSSVEPGPARRAHPRRGGVPRALRQHPSNQRFKARCRVCRRLDEAEPDRVRHDLDAALGAELALDVRDVDRSSLLADEERLSRSHRSTGRPPPAAGPRAHAHSTPGASRPTSLIPRMERSPRILACHHDHCAPRVDAQDLPEPALSRR